VRRCLTAEAQGHAHYAEGALRGSQPGWLKKIPKPGLRAGKEVNQ